MTLVAVALITLEVDENAVFVVASAAKLVNVLGLALVVTAVVRTNTALVVTVLVTVDAMKVGFSDAVALVAVVVAVVESFIAVVVGAKVAVGVLVVIVTVVVGATGASVTALVRTASVLRTHWL